MFILKNFQENVFGWNSERLYDQDVSFSKDEPIAGSFLNGLFFNFRLFTHDF